MEADRHVPQAQGQAYAEKSGLVFMELAKRMPTICKAKDPSRTGGPTPRPTTVRPA